MIHPTAKVSEEVNKTLPARKMSVQFLTLYSDPEPLLLLLLLLLVYVIVTCNNFTVCLLCSVYT